MAEQTVNRIVILAATLIAAPAIVCCLTSAGPRRIVVAADVSDSAYRQSSEPKGKFEPYFVRVNHFDNFVLSGGAGRKLRE